MPAAVKTTPAVLVGSAGAAEPMSAPGFIAHLRRCLPPVSGRYPMGVMAEWPDCVGS